ncbi:hypothetical protein KW441_14080 [Vibrio fluvialis]|nr:hypothetical protein [Vibrio fluvialis]
MYAITPEQARKQLTASAPSMLEKAARLRAEADQLEDEAHKYLSWGVGKQSPLETTEAQKAVLQINRSVAENKQALTKVMSDIDRQQSLESMRKR